MIEEKKKDNKKPVTKPAHKKIRRTVSSDRRKEKQPDVKNVSERETKSKRKTGVISAFIGLAVVFYAVFTFMMGGVVLYYFISFNSSSGEKTLYSVRYINENGKTIKNVGKSDSNNIYGLYVSLSDIDDLCGISYAGDGDKLTLMFYGSGETAVCRSDSSFVYINDIPTRLSSPILYENREYYFPIEFVEEYFDGVSVRYENDVCILELRDGDDTVLGLKFKKHSTTDGIDEPK